MPNTNSIIATVTGSHFQNGAYGWASLRAAAGGQAFLLQQQ